MIFEFGSKSKMYLRSLLDKRPDAVARLRGGANHQSIRGTVSFFQSVGGVLVMAEVNGLPAERGACAENIFGFHIHEGGSCTGNSKDPFADAGTHFNPNDCLHPQHAGDLPPLFGNNGYAFTVFLTDRFSVDDVIGRVLIIHSRPDDFTTQPAGNSGEKIACGMIRKN